MRRWMTVMLRACFLAACVLVAGCETLGIGQGDKHDDAADVVETVSLCEADPMSAGCVCEEFGQDSLNCRCAEDPARIECELCGSASTGKLRTQALVGLGEGSYDSGRHLLRCAVAERPSDSNSRLLLDQLENPRGFFEDKFGPGTTDYTMRYGETLGEVAQRCLGNSLYFVGLALINDLPNPSKVGVSQRLVLPGNTTCPEPAVAVSPPPTAPPEPETPSSGADEGTPDMGTSPSLPPTDDQPGLPEVDPEAPDTDRWLEEFADLLFEGREAEACAKLDQILDLDPENGAAALNKNEFCGGVTTGR